MCTHEYKRETFINVLFNNINHKNKLKLYTEPAISIASFALSKQICRFIH